MRFGVTIVEPDGTLVVDEHVYLDAVAHIYSKRKYRKIIDDSIDIESMSIREGFERLLILLEREPKVQRLLGLNNRKFDKVEIAMLEDAFIRVVLKTEFDAVRFSEESLKEDDDEISRIRKGSKVLNYNKRGLRLRIYRTNPLTAEGLRLTQDVIKISHLLNRIGLKKAINGVEVYFVHQAVLGEIEEGEVKGVSIMGRYYRSQDTIALAKDIGDCALYAFLHEIGHRIDFKFTKQLMGVFREGACDLFSASPTEYGKCNGVELWAESFATYIANRGCLDPRLVHAVEEQLKHDGFELKKS